MYPPTNNQTTVSVVDQETMARARYAAYAQRRSMPPRCSPFAILLLVLSAGLLFIGITMTIIAHWPGATSIGENPLKIAGPVLLGAGVAVLIFAVVLMVKVNARERRKWHESLSKYAAERSAVLSRQPIISSDPAGGVYDPSDKYSSQYPSTYRQSKGSNEGSGPDSGAPPYYSLTGGPGGANGKPGDLGYDPQSQVPDPVRIIRSRASNVARDHSSAGSANDSSEIGAADLGTLGVYSPSGRRVGSPSAYANVGYDNTEPGGEGGGRYGGQGGSQMAQERFQGRDDNWPSDFQKQQQQQHLKVHIKAQPGTAVHITPTATPPATGEQRRSSKRGRQKHRPDSSETEI